HVDHPGGLNPEGYTVNALAAESRRAARFFRFGHTPKQFQPAEPKMSPDYPCTLDLRRQSTR
ncbi:MAG: transglutaminase family protein, partial [Planctomyces sp.]